MLKNILGITNEVELSKEEERITKLKALELFDSNKINEIEVGTFEGLSKIHNFLFKDIYEFAGKIRTDNIAKGNFRFASVLYLKDILRRIWLDMILKKELNKVIDWSKINKEDYLLAMERSPVRDTEIKLLLKSALTDDVNNRDVYMKGIDASYYYEGYNTYQLEELENKN